MSKHSDIVQRKMGFQATKRIAFSRECANREAIQVQRMRAIYEPTAIPTLETMTRGMLALMSDTCRVEISRPQFAFARNFLSRIPIRPRRRAVDEQQSLAAVCGQAPGVKADGIFGTDGRAGSSSCALAVSPQPEQMPIRAQKAKLPRWFVEIRHAFRESPRQLCRGRAIPSRLAMMLRCNAGEPARQMKPGRTRGLVVARTAWFQRAFAFSRWVFYVSRWWIVSPQLLLRYLQVRRHFCDRQCSSGPAQFYFRPSRRSSRRRLPGAEAASTGFPKTILRVAWATNSQRPGPHRAGPRSSARAEMKLPPPPIPRPLGKVLFADSMRGSNETAQTIPTKSSNTPAGIQVMARYPATVKASQASDPQKPEGTRGGRLTRTWIGTIVLPTQYQVPKRVCTLRMLRAVEQENEMHEHIADCCRAERCHKDSPSMR